MRSKLSRARIEKYKRQLLSMRDDVLRELDYCDHELAEANRDAAAYSIPKDQCDQASDSHEIDTGYHVLETEAMLLDEIEAALERINDGTFGICEITGRPIRPARLDAIPYARHSIGAQAEYERIEERRRAEAELEARRAERRAAHRRFMAHNPDEADANRVKNRWMHIKHRRSQAQKNGSSTEIRKAM